MQGEERGYKPALPDLAGQPEEKNKEEDGGEGMNPDVREVMALGIKAIQLHVRHVGEPGDRVPVGGMHRGEGPANVRRCQTGCNMGVFRNVTAVVIIYKVMGSHLPIYGYRHGRDIPGTGDIPGTQCILLFPWPAWLAFA